MNSSLMLKRIGWWFMVLSVSGAVACSGDKADEPMTVVVGDVFTVGMGKTAVLPSENLTITFDSVLEDSRCPTNVDCFWSGQARVMVTVQQGEGDALDLEFNTNPAPDMNQQSLAVGSYVVALQSLDPYPQEADKVIEAEEYRLTLQVTQP